MGLGEYRAANDATRTVCGGTLCDHVRDVNRNCKKKGQSAPKRARRKEPQRRSQNDASFVDNSRLVARSAGAGKAAIAETRCWQELGSARL